MYDRKIKVTDIPEKIAFAQKRHKLFSEWNAPAKLKQIKINCMAALCEQISFLQDARQCVLSLKKRG